MARARNISELRAVIDQFRIVESSAYNASKRECVVYFVAAKSRSSGRLDALKIGCQLTGRDVRRRIDGLRTGCPDELILLGTIEGANLQTERAIHARFERLCIRGEWFQLKGELREFVDAIFPPEIEV